MWRKILLALAVLLLLVAAYLFFWPVPIDPVAWTPPEAPPLEGVYAENARLARAERLAVDGNGPEDVAVDAQGRIYGGLDDGRIVRLAPDGSDAEVFVDTGGRPLGLAFDVNGNLIVADAIKGLISVAPNGEIEVLSTELDDKPYGFTDDVDIAPDGTIYFSDASYRWHHPNFREDVLESRPYGRLLAYDPQAGETRLVLDGLYFANGVAVSPDGGFVLVNETTRYRVLRHWLSGPRAGETEVLIDNLPGFPDGVSTGSQGRFWIAFFSPRLSTLDSTLPKPWLRRLIYRLPEFLQPAPARHGLVLGVDASGRVVNNLQDPDEESYSPVTSVQEHAGMLYLGSLSYPAIGRLPVPEPETEPQ